MKTNKNFPNGLSIIQIVILFGVIAVIAGFILSFFNPLRSIRKMNDKQRKLDIIQIQKVLEEYFRDRGRYPSSLNYRIVDFKTNTPINWGNPWIPYMNMLPKDPDENKSYVYYATNNNQTFYLYASLEDNSDPDRCLSAGPGVCESIKTNKIPDLSCGKRCNFGVSSFNTSP